MSDRDTVQSGPQLNSRLLAGGVLLMGIGAAIGLAGVALGSTAVITAARRWVRQMETPPSELAKQHWNRARVATAAGVGAWRNGQQTQQAET
jgi:membrane protein implicated in regulation of membrane protease activity